MLQECYYGKTIRVYSVTQHSVDTVTNKEVKDKILAKTINACTERTEYSKIQGKLLKMANIYPHFGLLQYE